MLSSRKVAKLIKDHYANKYSDKKHNKFPVGIAIIQPNLKTYEVTLFSEHPGVLIGPNGTDVDEISKLLNIEANKHNLANDITVKVLFVELNEVVYI